MVFEQTKYSFAFFYATVLATNKLHFFDFLVFIRESNVIFAVIYKKVSNLHFCHILLYALRIFVSGISAYFFTYNGNQIISQIKCHVEFKNSQWTLWLNYFQVAPSGSIRTRFQGSAPHRLLLVISLRPDGDLVVSLTNPTISKIIVCFLHNSLKKIMCTLYWKYTIEN